MIVLSGGRRSPDGFFPPSHHGQKVTRKASERLNPDMPAAVSRYQYWKFHVLAEAICPGPLLAGNWVESTRRTVPNTRRTPRARWLDARNLLGLFLL